MKHRFLYQLYLLLLPFEFLFGLEIDFAYDYYMDDIECIKLGEKFMVKSFCRKNKFTREKQFRTERPMMNGADFNEWITYE